MCVAIEAGKFMHIKKRERFMQDLSLDMRNIFAELLRNIIDFYDSAKNLPNGSCHPTLIWFPVNLFSPRSVIESEIKDS